MLDASRAGECIGRQTVRSPRQHLVVVSDRDVENASEREICVWKGRIDNPGQASCRIRWHESSWRTAFRPRETGASVARSAPSSGIRLGGGSGGLANPTRVTPEESKEARKGHRGIRGIQPACEYRFHCIVCTLLGRGISSSRHRSFGFVHARTSGRRRTISMDGPTPEVARRVLSWVRGKSDRLPASSAKRWFSDHRVGYAITRVVTRIRRP